MLAFTFDLSTPLVKLVDGVEAKLAIAWWGPPARVGRSLSNLLRNFISPGAGVIVVTIINSSFIVVEI
jgi:hypothetical protein